jgi:hypothetical protein
MKIFVWDTGYKLIRLDSSGLGFVPATGCLFFCVGGWRCKLQMNVACRSCAGYITWIPREEQVQAATVKLSPKRINRTVENTQSKKHTAPENICIILVSTSVSGIWWEPDWRSRHCTMVRNGARIFLFSKPSRPVLGPSKTPIQCLFAGVFSENKAPGVWKWPLSSI